MKKSTPPLNQKSTPSLNQPILSDSVYFLSCIYLAFVFILGLTANTTVAVIFYRSKKASWDFGLWDPLLELHKPANLLVLIFPGWCFQMR